MFVFGHLGFGSVLAHPWRDRGARWALLLGMLLPDIIDKPLYYARLSDVFSCTRTVGHTGLLALALLVAGLLGRRRTLAALATGMFTHLLLDCVMDVVVGSTDRSAIRAALWPFLGVDFVWVRLLANLPFPILAGIIARKLPGIAPREVEEKEEADRG